MQGRSRLTSIFVVSAWQGSNWWNTWSCLSSNIGTLTIRLPTLHYCTVLHWGIELKGFSLDSQPTQSVHMDNRASDMQDRYRFLERSQTDLSATVRIGRAANHDTPGSRIRIHTWVCSRSFYTIITVPAMSLHIEHLVLIICSTCE